jgi:hypothetical protein
MIFSMQALVLNLLGSIHSIGTFVVCDDKYVDRYMYDWDSARVSPYFPKASITNRTTIPIQFPCDTSHKSTKTGQISSNFVVARLARSRCANCLGGMTAMDRCVVAAYRCNVGPRPSLWQSKWETAAAPPAIEKRNARH